MELLAGAKENQRYARLQRLLVTYEFLPTESPSDYVAAADIYRRCRAAGLTIRKMTDCLIAAVAIRTGAEVLHQDKDFDAIARVTGLRVHAA
jgi:predicted nucleic acid-binding protein